MGVVFIAYQQTLKRQIALKLIPKAILNHRWLSSFNRKLRQLPSFPS